MKKFLIASVVVLIAAGSAVSGYLYKRRPVEPQVSTAAVSLGDVIQVVGATGTIEAVTTVDVGTQVTGVVKEMYGIDFNSIVTKGQLVAKIDPATIEAKIESVKAQLESATANLQRQRIALEDARVKLRRAEDLFGRRLITEQDLENAQVSVKTNETSIRSLEASIKQTQASLNQEEVNLGYTDIFAPINGIVINRKVDVGQTVVSNNAATSLFQIAADLKKLQVKASVDESDVGLLRPGQRVTFRVAAYQGREFVGTVGQVRLQPVVTQNVVMYTTIISVPNPDLELKPGMTANVTIEIVRRQNVLRVPAAAVRFRPTRDILDALQVPMPEDVLARGRKAVTSGGSGTNALARGGGDRGTEDAHAGKSIADRGAETVDALFGPLTFTPSPGRVWVYAVGPVTKAKSLKSIAVQTGIGDGNFFELVDPGGLTDGMLVVTSVDTGRGTAGRSNNPLMPGRPMMGGGGHGDH